MVVVEVLEASVLVVLVEVLETVLDPRPALEVEVLGTEAVVRDPRLVLEALVRGTVEVLGVLDPLHLVSVLGYASLGENEDLP